MRYWLPEALKVFAVPLILIIILFFALPRFIDFRNQELARIVLAVMLGVLLGFTADLTKRGVDDLSNKHKIRKVAKRLLEEDARGIYRSVWLWDKLQKDSNIPANLKGSVPPKLDLQYWDIMRKNSEFLMLAADAPFDDIFKAMLEFEKINEQIRLAEGGKAEACQFARAFYLLSMQEKSHKKLLLLFKTEREIEDLDRKHIEASKERHPR